MSSDLRLAMTMTAHHSLPAVVTTRAALRTAVEAARSSRKTVGFVPTMGALHAGHLSLVEESHRECDFTVVSIFVNPTQFAPHEDFDRYPRDLSRDLHLLAPHTVDLVFAPERQEMYPARFATSVDVGPVSERLEGSVRPNHFSGVATVVLKLFQMVAPDVAFFGQKDYQQTLVVRQMVDDLNVRVAIRVCPTVREVDGLALSSRNAYLSVEDRHIALALSRALATAVDRFAAGQRDARKIESAMREVLEHFGDRLVLDYATIADADTLLPVEQATARNVALVAARLGSVRLIDNCFLDQRPLWKER